MCTGFPLPCSSIGAGSRSSVTSGVVAEIIPVPVAVIRIRIVGPRKCAGDDRAHGEAAKRWAPAPPARIRRGGRGNCRDRDSRRCESGKKFPHGVHLDLETAVLKRELSRNVPQGLTIKRSWAGLE